jgi:hypothetical protein
VVSVFSVVLLQFHFGPGMIFPDPYPDQDPAKSFRSDRIRIHNTDFATLGPDPEDECMTMIFYLGEGADAGGTVVANIVQNECMTMIFYLGEGADAGGAVVANIVQNECMKMIFYLGKGADAGGTVVADIMQNDILPWRRSGRRWGCCRKYRAE